MSYRKCEMWCTVTVFLERSFFHRSRPWEDLLQDSLILIGRNRNDYENQMFCLGLSSETGLQCWHISFFSVYAQWLKGIYLVVCAIALWGTYLHLWPSRFRHNAIFLLAIGVYYFRNCHSRNPGCEQYLFLFKMTRGICQTIPSFLTLARGFTELPPHFQGHICITHTS